VDPRTFLPPRELPTARAPRPGDPAPALPRGAELEPGRAAVIAFLRHTGCPFAEATMRELRDAADAHPEIAWIAVSHAPAEATDRWCRAVGGLGAGGSGAGGPGAAEGQVRVVSDPTRRSYADWGLGRTNLAHFLGRDSLTAVAELARHRGIRNRHPSGTRWQSAGTFAVDGGRVVRWRHVPAHAGDLPDLTAAASALTQ
jgi:hypothetical protein